MSAIPQSAATHVSRIYCCWNVLEHHPCINKRHTSAIRISLYNFKVGQLQHGHKLAAESESQRTSSAPAPINSRGRSWRCSSSYGEALQPAEWKWIRKKIETWTCILNSQFYDPISGSMALTGAFLKYQKLFTEQCQQFSLYTNCIQIGRWSLTGTGTASPFYLRPFISPPMDAHDPTDPSPYQSFTQGNVDLWWTPSSPSSSSLSSSVALPSGGRGNTPRSSTSRYLQLRKPGCLATLQQKMLIYCICS